MVQPFEPGRGQAALRAWPRLVVQLNLFGLYAADEKEENGSPPFSLFFLGSNDYLTGKIISPPPKNGKRLPIP